MQSTAYTRHTRSARRCESECVVPTCETVRPIKASIEVKPALWHKDHRKTVGALPHVKVLSPVFRHQVIWHLHHAHGADARLTPKFHARESRTPCCSRVKNIVASNKEAVSPVYNQECSHCEVIVVGLVLTFAADRTIAVVPEPSELCLRRRA